MTDPQKAGSVRNMVRPDRFELRTFWFVAMGVIRQLFHQFRRFHCLGATRGICLLLRKSPFGTSYVGF